MMKHYKIKLVTGENVRVYTGLMLKTIFEQGFVQCENTHKFYVLNNILSFELIG